MTNPIQRAGNHLHRMIVFGGADSDVFALAQLAFESIDVDDLEGVIRKVMLRGAIVADVDLPTYIAHAVKAHLTGKEDQE